MDFYRYYYSYVEYHTYLKQIRNGTVVIMYVIPLELFVFANVY